MRRWANVATYAVVFVLLAMLFMYIGYAINDNNKRWCSTLSDLTPVDPRTLPDPTTDLGKQNRPNDIRTYDALRKRMHDFGCFD